MQYKSINFKSYTLISVLVLNTLMGSTYSHSDDFFELELNQLPDIPVEVASLFEDSALDVASSTAIVQASTIRDKGINTLGHALESVPSVFTSTTWGGAEAISIRGYSTELSVRGTAFYLDDIPLGTFVYASTSYILPRAPLDLFDEVEMIRGPGSTLYGTDAFHGVIAFNLASSPVNQSEGFIQLGSPNFQQVSFKNSHYNEDWKTHSGLSFTQDGDHNLAFHFNDPISGELESSERDHQYDNLSAFLKTEKGHISAKNGKFGLTLFHNQFHSEQFQGVGTQFYSGLAEQLDIKSISLAQEGDISGSDSHLSVFGMNHEILLGNQIQIKNQLYYWQAQQEWEFDNSQYPESFETLSGFTVLCRENENNLAPNEISSIYCSHTLYQGADESRQGYAVQIKQAKNELNTQWVVGAGFDIINVDNTRFERIDENGVSINNVNASYRDKDRKISHIMAQGRSGFLEDKLLITYGLRWDHYSDVSDHLSPRLGLVYKASKNWTHKLLYGHAYRAPTAIEQFGSGPALGDENLNAETIDTYEYVFIYNEPDFSWETVLFYSHWHDAIALAPTGNGTENQYANIAENNSQGFEWNINKILGQFSLHSNISYVTSKNRSENTSYSAFPTWLISLGSEYRWGKSKVGLWHRAMMDYELTDENQFEESTNQNYQRTDAYLTYPLQTKMDLGLHVYNVFDRNNALPSYYGSQGGLPDYGTLMKLSFNYRF